MDGGGGARKPGKRLGGLYGSYGYDLFGSCDYLLRWRSPTDTMRLARRGGGGAVARQRAPDSRPTNHNHRHRYRSRLAVFTLYDLLDIPPPMTYEARSVDEMECDAE